MGEPNFSDFLSKILTGEGDAPQNLHEAFSYVVQYFENINQILKTGSKEEIEKALEEYKSLQADLDTSIGKMAEESGLTPEILQEQFSKRENFTEADWEALQVGKEEVEKVSKDLPKPQEKPKTKKKKRKGWVKS